MGLPLSGQRLGLGREKETTITQQKSSGLGGIIWSLGHGSLDVGSLDRGPGQGGGTATPSSSNTGMLWKTEVLWLT